MIRFDKNIFGLLKTGLMILLLAFCLVGCKVDDKNVTGSETSDEQQEELREQQRACWQGSLLGLFYDVTGTASLKAFPIVTKGAMPLIMVAFAVWLSLRVLKHIGSVVEESPAEVWTEVAKVAFACLFCGILASSTEMLIYTLNTFILPIYYTFLEFGSRIVELAAQDGDTNPPGQMLGETCLIYSNNLVCAAPPLEKLTSASTEFPQGPSDLMQCLACALSDRMQLGFTIAKDLLGQLSLSSFIAGIFIYAIFIIVKISFVFYMVDSIFRLCMMVIILPFLILAIPFKVTRKWSKQGFLTILNSSANMMCLAVIVTMAMLAMQMVVQDNTEELGNKGNYMEFSLVMLSMILIAFLVLKSAGLAVSMANSLVGGGGGTDFQKKIGKLAMWAGKTLVGIVTAGAGKVFTATIDRIEALRKIRENSRAASSFFSRIAGRDRSEDD
jgi:hypothetical protein